MLTDEIGQIEAAARYAYACLAGSVVDRWVDWPCKVGTFVLDSGFRWGQSHSFANEGDTICLDQELFGISARVDDDAAATGCGVDRSLDRLTCSDTNRLIASFLSCRFRSAQHRYSSAVACQTFGFWQSRSTNEWHEQCNEEDF